MSILIVYISKHGTVEEVARQMKKISKEKVDIKRLSSQVTASMIDKYDSIIIGGSIHMGKAPRKLIQFCKQFAQPMKEKKSGIFLCTLTPAEEAMHYIEESFPQEVVKETHALGLFGGAIPYENMNVIEKMMMKKITGEEESFSRIDHNKIVAFIESF